MFIRIFKVLFLCSVASFVFSGCSSVGISNTTINTDTYAKTNDVVEAVGLEVYKSDETVEITIDTKTEILVAMEDKYKVFKKAWRVNEREEDEEPLEYYLKYAETAVTGILLQKGVDFFSGPPQGYASSLRETLVEATVKSRTSDRAVVSAVWEEETVGDGIHSKDVYYITIKLKKEEQEWFISDLKSELISQEEIGDPSDF